MSFKISIKCFTGHEELDEEIEAGEPEVFTFETRGEKQAFERGVRIASEALDGWTDGYVQMKDEAWVETKKL